MSELLVIGYEDQETATKVLQEMGKLQADYVVDLENAAVVTRDEKGKLKVESTHGIPAEGGLWGMFWGMLIGLIFFVPFAGAAVGGLFGMAGGALAKMGIDDDFKKQIGDLVQPGSSALMVVVAKSTPDKMLEALEPYGGTVLRTSLSHDAEEQFQKALHGDGEAPPVGESSES